MVKRWTEDEIICLKEHFLKDGADYVSIRLNRTIRSVRKKAFKIGLNRGRYNKEIKYIEKECQICKRTFISLRSKKRIYCSIKCKNEGHKKRFIELKSNDYIKSKLIKERGYKCEVCGYKKIITLHHKDFNRNNNRKQNLQLLCPNHHYEKHWNINTQIET